MAARNRPPAWGVYWKQQTCAGCGSTFRYKITREPAPTGNAVVVALSAVRQLALRMTNRDGDLVPCPACGAYQPDMVGSRRALWHAILTVAWFIPLALLIPLRVEWSFPVSWLCPLVAVWWLVLLGAHVLIACSNPNRNPEQNLERLSRLPRNRGVELVEEEPADRPQDGSPKVGPHVWHAAALILLGVAALAALSGEAARLAREWPLNEGWDPAVIGPGDESRVFFPGQIKSIRGFWRGESDVQVTNAAEVGASLRGFRCSSRTDTWERGISARYNELEESFTPWVRIEFPDNPELAGKELRLSVVVRPTYPVPAGGNTLRDQKDTLTQDATVRLAHDRHAGQTYLLLSYGGVGGGLLAGGLAGWWFYLLGRRLRRSAHPALVTPLREEDMDKAPRRRRQDDNSSESEVRPRRRRTDAHEGRDG
jgi:hypothetical protein